MIKLDFLMTTGVVISHPDHIKHVFSKRQKNYPKDNELSFKPFLDILGTGIVTSHGESWKRQRRCGQGDDPMTLWPDTACSRGVLHSFKQHRVNASLNLSTS